MDVLRLKIEKTSSEVYRRQKDTLMCVFCVCLPLSQLVLSFFLSLILLEVCLVLVTVGTPEGPNKPQHGDSGLS